MNEQSIKDRIQSFNDENVPFYIVDHEDGQYSLCLCFLYAEDDYCQESFDRYAREIGDEPRDARGFYTHGNGYEWESAFKKAFETDEKLNTLYFDSESDGFYCYCKDLSALEDFGRRFKSICEDTDKFAPIVSAGIKEEEIRESEERRFMETVGGQIQEKLKRNPLTTFDIRTPNDRFYVEASTGKQLLDGTLQSVESDTGTEMSANEFLEMKVTAIQEDLFSDELYRMMAEVEQEEILFPTMKM